MNRLVLSLCLVGASCVLPRTLRLDAPTPHVDEPGLVSRWKAGELVAHAQRGGDAQSALRDFAPLKEQLERRLQKTLTAQDGLGYSALQPEYEVGVEVEVIDTSGLNPWIIAGLSAETGVLLAGSAIGTLVGGPPGGLLGLLVAAPLAVTAALAPRATTELGEFELKLVLRRAGGDVVATRHLRQTWHGKLDGFGREEKLAALSGDAVLELEHALLDALREVLLEASGVTAAPQE